MKKHLFLVLAGALVSFCVAATDADNANKASDIGKSLGLNLMDYASGNMETMSNSVSGKGNALKTLDGTEATANLVCGNSGDYLRLSYSGSGNISIKVEVDENLDGSWDRNFNFSNVSGICTNGIQQNSKNYYLWQYNGGSLSLKPALDSDMGGCYCVGANCSGVSQERSKILQDLGGAISSLFMNASSFVVSNTIMEGNYLKYTAQDMSGCANTTAQGSTYQSVDSEGNLTTQAEEQIAIQENNELSAWSIFKGGSDNSDKYADEMELMFENNIEKQVKNAQSTAGYNASTNGFSYIDPNTNTRISATLNLGDTSTNIEFCQVKVLEADTSIYNDGSNKATATTSATTYTTDIKQCVNDTCPVKSGESMVYDCGKIDGMGNAVAMLSLVEEMQEDSKCVK